MNEKLIGILAEMGPRSTAPFIDLVIDKCQFQYGTKYDEEFPQMMNSLLENILVKCNTIFYCYRPDKNYINGYKSFLF